MNFRIKASAFLLATLLLATQISLAFAHEETAQATQGKSEIRLTVSQMENAIVINLDF